MATSKFLYHEYADLEGNAQVAAFVDGNGRMYKIPAFEPTEIDSPFMADKIVEHCWTYGIVEVGQTRTKTGINFNMEDAVVRCRQAFDAALEKCWREYINGQLEDRVQKNFPPLPPKGFQLEAVIRKRINLLAWGIKPVGWEPPYQPDPIAAVPSQPPSIPTQTDDLIKQLLSEVRQQADTIRSLQQVNAMRDAARAPRGKLKEEQKPAGAEQEQTATL